MFSDTLFALNCSLILCSSLLIIWKRISKKRFVSSTNIMGSETFRALLRSFTQVKIGNGPIIVCDGTLQVISSKLVFFHWMRNIVFGFQMSFEPPNYNSINITDSKIRILWSVVPKTLDRSMSNWSIRLCLVEWPFQNRLHLERCLKRWLCIFSKYFGKAWEMVIGP